MIQYLRLLLLILSHGRWRHSMYNINQRRNIVLNKLEPFIPEGAITLKNAHIVQSWIWRNPITRNLLTQIAFVKSCYRQSTARLSSPALKIAYVRIPKSANTSVSYALFESMYPDLAGKKISSEEINFLTDAHLRTNPASDETLFTVVRNPFARIVSVYRDFYENTTSHFIYEDYLFGILRKPLSFTGFVHRLRSIPDPLKDQHLRPQWMFTDPFLKRAFKVVILKLEQPEKIDSFLSGYNLKIPHLNKSTTDYDYRMYYDLNSFKIVKNIYKKDIQIFGYTDECDGLEVFLKNKLTDNSTKSYTLHIRK